MGDVSQRHPDFAEFAMKFLAEANAGVRARNAEKSAAAAAITPLRLLA